MTIVFMIMILFVGGLIAWFCDRFNPRLPRVIAMAALIIDAVILLTTINSIALPPEKVWFLQYSIDWIPQFGIQVFFAMDGLSLALVSLTLIIGIVAVLSAWTEISERCGFFYFNLLWTLAGVVGIFSSLDLFLFFFFWEVMLIPMYFIISIWGHEKKDYAALKFFIFTQVSGLLMLLSIIALVMLHHEQTGIYTFNYHTLLATKTDSVTGYWIMLGFFIAFIVKLPSIPFHSWLPDAHTQAPTPGSVVLAGLLLKTGGYGLVRFIVPLFPEVAAKFSPIAMTLGVVSIIYAAKLAFAQYDLKRLIAYTSISHMGFVLLGVFAWNALALQGAVMQMLAHGISSAALFALAGGLQHRLHTRDMRNMGGLSSKVPRTAAIGMFFLIAALGMPGLGNFVGETLVLFGTYSVNKTLCVLATLGLIVAPVYALKVIQRVFHGEPNVNFKGANNITDLSKHELLMMGIMIVAIVGLGVYPQPVIDLLQPAISQLSLQTYPTLSQRGP